MNGMRVLRNVGYLALACEVSFLALLVVLVTRAPAEAYIHPGATTLIWEAVLAVCFAVFLYIRRIVRAVRPSNRNPDAKHSVDLDRQ